MRIHDTAATLALGSALVYVAVSGKGDKLATLFREDGADISKAIAAALILTYIARALPGRWGDIMDGLLALAMISAALAKTPQISREIDRLFKRT